jgi:uncharacterized protein (TIGR01777 family)
MTTVLITGGTGLIGKALTEALVERNYKVIILSREKDRKQELRGNVRYAYWNVESGEIDAEAIQNADYLVHLAGANVAGKRWTDQRKKEIVDSRVNSAALLVKACSEKPNKIKAVISASAIGWYGPDPVIPNPNPFREDDPADPSFLGDTCRKWEESVEKFTDLDKRLVVLRTGIVLSEKGGALEEFRKPVKFGIAAILGDGKQVCSWIHIDDLVRIYIAAIEDDNMRGVYNAVAPKPVSNKVLTLALAREIKGKFFIAAHVPVFVLKAMLGEMSIEVLKSATVSCDKLHYTGFTFVYPVIGPALRNLVKTSS